MIIKAKWLYAREKIYDWMIRTVWYAHSDAHSEIDIKMTRTPDSSYSKKYLTQKFFESQKTQSPKNVSKIRKYALISELPVAFNLDIPYNLGYVTYFFKWIANVSEVPYSNRINELIPNLQKVWWISCEKVVETVARGCENEKSL